MEIDIMFFLFNRGNSMIGVSNHFVSGYDVKGVILGSAILHPPRIEFNIKPF